MVNKRSGGWLVAHHPLTDMVLDRLRQLAALSQPHARAAGRPVQGALEQLRLATLGDAPLTVEALFVLCDWWGVDPAALVDPLVEVL